MRPAFGVLPCVRMPTALRSPYSLASFGKASLPGNLSLLFFRAVRQTSRARPHSLSTLLLISSFRCFFFISSCDILVCTHFSSALRSGWVDKTFGLVPGEVPFPETDSRMLSFGLEAPLPLPPPLSSMFEVRPYLVRVYVLSLL